MEDVQRQLLTIGSKALQVCDQLCGLDRQLLLYGGGRAREGVIVDIVHVW